VTTDQIPLIVDGNNVMGAVADGWWRDRAGAARRLVDRVRCYAARTDRPVTIVFDTVIPDVPEGEHEGIVVRYATRRGRNAGDDRIVELVRDGQGPVEVVTSDRDLVSRTDGPGHRHTGAGAFLHHLDQAGC
jgi:8-oxo-dGTP diphosphatase